MHSDGHPNNTCVIRQQGQQQFSVCIVQNIALGCLLSACLLSACITPGKTRNLTAAEIQESIIGNSLKKADSGDWKEDYLPASEDRREGMIRGHQRAPEGPYGGAWSIAGDSMCLEYPDFPEQSGCYRFSRGNGSRVLWFDEAGKLADETELIEKGDSEDVSFELLSSAFRQETVTFRHGENLLVGDLRLPNGPRPYPAIVFVAGSGPHSRHDYAFWFAKTIPDEFLSRGFATFVWSKPGVDESTGDYFKQSMALRAEEVAAAMTHLAERPDIDGDRIGLFGGSQAGWVMPMVPAHRNVAFVISVSGPARTGQEQDLYGVENELIRIGFSDDDLADALDHRREFYDLIRESENYEGFLSRHEEWLEEMKARPWYPALESRLDELIFQEIAFSMGPRDYEFFFINDVNASLIAPPQLKNLHMPVLAVYGSEDAIVDSNLGSNAYREISRINGNPDVTVKVFEGADHSITTRDSEGYLEFAPDYLTMMGEWLAEHR
jgi:pimeloyl-ACP methyl ester carboxylesterase